MTHASPAPSPVAPGPNPNPNPSPSPNSGPHPLLSQLLSQVATALGRPVPACWVRALHAVPRDLFLPGRVWLRDGAGGYVACDRGAEPVRWAEAAYGDVPVVTQIVEDDDGFQEPTSSASAPSTVLRMLEDAALADGHRVLEIGTGTGFHAALLAHRLGSGNVVSIEVDPTLAEAARTMLEAAGYAPAVVTGDGAHGHAAAAPYDRLISTCSVRSVPAVWLAQTAPGARLVVPWSTSWITYGTLVLTRHPDATATGRFAGYGSYMVMRGRRATADLDRDLLRMGQRPMHSDTALSPWAVAGGSLDAQFAIGLRVPDVWHSWDTGTGSGTDTGTGTGSDTNTDTDAGALADMRPVHTRLWLADDAATSWAAVDYDGRQTATYHVRQHGPRRLWDEIEAAHRQWIHAGEPEIARHGLTVTTEGQRLHIDDALPHSNASTTSTITTNPDRTNSTSAPLTASEGR
ncbi:methyltransferase domain-containing protein [Streptomyces sp. NPDC052496]|uniref:methyltransferase domain-containing protein n=1 Tax=Streptomyces sp. NPDC052496 TaxID=3154951 RepID=UPI0034213708